jgi:hypothetical protein
LRSALLWDITKVLVVIITDISGPAIGHNIAGQKIQEEKLFKERDEHRA